MFNLNKCCHTQWWWFENTLLPVKCLRKDISFVQNKSDMQILWTKKMLCPLHTCRLSHWPDVHQWFNIWAESAQWAFTRRRSPDMFSFYPIINLCFMPTKSQLYVKVVDFFFPLQVYIVLSGNLFWEEIEQWSYNTKWIDWNDFSQLLRHA